jgi:hypothetical protein
MKTPDVVRARVPGGMLALFAFMLTVLLGIGGTSAVALWQQSATATMSVSAAANWSSISITCSDGSNNSNKSIILTVTPAGTVTQPMYIASRSLTGTYGTETTVGTSITLQPTSALVTSAIGSASAGFAVRIRAEVDGQWTSSEITTLSVNAGNSKIYCA